MDKNMFKMRKFEKKDTSTFKCPNCGTKVLKATGYCLKCKKKVKPAKKESVSRYCEIWRTQDNKWYVSLSEKEYGTESSANPDGFFVDNSGSTYKRNPIL